MINPQHSVQQSTALEHQINNKLGTEKLLKGNKENLEKKPILMKLAT